MPLQKVDVKARITGALATVDIELGYKNLDEECPLETTYEFPLDKMTVLSKLHFSVDGKTIEAKVKAKEEAKEKYEDAIAAGNAAVMAERDSKKAEKMTVKLGNLLP